MARSQSVDREAREMAAPARISQPVALSIFERFLRPLIGRLNPLILLLAGRPWFPTFSVLHHRGHRSGKLYTTPISALPRGGFFWVGLAFGEEAGWARNVMAAGEGELRYRGTDYRLVEPMVVDGSAVKSLLPLLMRVAMPLVGIHKILRMRPLSA
jgi:deazaflavin-dependent oxidoreductase (nitroreductase family)